MIYIILNSNTPQCHFSHHITKQHSPYPKGKGPIPFKNILLSNGTHFPVYCRKLSFLFGSIFLYICFPMVQPELFYSSKHVQEVFYLKRPKYLFHTVPLHRKVVTISSTSVLTGNHSICSLNREVYIKKKTNKKTYQI